MGISTETNRSNFIARYSIAAFIILVTILGGGTIFLVVQGLIPSGLALLSVLSASLAGIIMTLFEDGWDGLKLMLHRLLIWRVGLGYWLFALLFIFMAILIGSSANPFFNGDPPSLNNLEPSLEIIPLFISFTIIAALGQELGWTGFLAPRLQARYSALTSSVIRAFLEILWHLPLLFYARLQLPVLADFPYAGWIAQQGFFVALFVQFLIFLLPWSIFFTWIFNNTRGSLLLVVILHGSEFWAAYWMLRTGISPTNLDNYWGYGAILVITALIIVTRTGPQNLSRSHPRIVHQPASG
jgi:membrane protease YdiL (CAAX protease family)